MKRVHTGPIRLTDNNKEHLGFLLLAGEERAMDDGTFEGECVFMPIPQNPEVMIGGPFRILTEHQKAGDHRYEFSVDGDHGSYLVAGPLERKIRVTLGPEGTGEWGICKESTELKRLGFSHAMPPKQKA